MNRIRAIEATDYPQLEEFCYQAIFLPPGREPLSRDIIHEPSIFAYINGFGGKDDVGIVAEDDGDIIGIAWSRILAEPSKEGYGNVDARTPELAISVLP